MLPDDPREHQVHIDALLLIRKELDALQPSDPRSRSSTLASSFSCLRRRANLRNCGASSSLCSCLASSMKEPAQTVPHPDSHMKLTIPPVEAFLNEPVALVDSGGVPEQYHVFDRASARRSVQLAAKRPLRVRGEPGVGKTQLAAAAAKVLRRPSVPHVGQRRTESRNLLWSFDAVMRLADAQAASSFLNPSHSCGSDIEEGSAGWYRATQGAAARALDVADYVRPGPLWWAFDWESARGKRSGAGRRLLPMTDRTIPRTGGSS